MLRLMFLVCKLSILLFVVMCRLILGSCVCSCLSCGSSYSVVMLMLVVIVMG